MAIAGASRPARESHALVAPGMPHMEGVEAATSAKALLSAASLSCRVAGKGIGPLPVARTNVLCIC
jgi:hypothetical protein